MFFKSAAILVVNLIATTGQAQTTEIAGGHFEKIFADMNSSVKSQRCADINLKNAKIGTTCETTQGVEFRRVKVNGKLAIKDLGENGLIWFDEIITGIDQYDAIKVCSRKEQWLPSKLNFDTAESHGFREAFANDMKQASFWTSDIDPLYETRAFMFKGTFGHTAHTISRRGPYATHSARCVELPLSS